MTNHSLTSWLPVKSKNSRRKNDAKIRVERLEDRTTPAIFTVTWDGLGADTGLSLQEAITAANASAGVPDQINYAPGVAASWVTSAGVAGPLPDITDTLTIDGISGGTKISVFLDSTVAGDQISGFVIAGGANNSTIRNLTITDPAGNFFNGIPEFAIKVNAAGGGFNLQNVDITNIDGDGVVIVDSPNNSIGGPAAAQAVSIGTLFAPNNGNGVRISGALSTGNTVQQTTIIGNAGDGVRIDTGAAKNTIGGFTATSGNLIIQNNGSGVHLNDSDGNLIQRSLIGTDGTDSKANGQNGIFIENGADNNIIGGSDLTIGNKLSGNNLHGIYIKNSAGNRIESNFIGLNSKGDLALANSGNGILVENAANTKIGSTGTAPNYISANFLHGVSIVGAGSAGTTVVNNRIGTVITEDAKLGNFRDGISVSGGADSITIGGTAAKASNVILGNRNGIAVTGGSSSVTIQGNEIGLRVFIDTDGKASFPSLGNQEDGILVDASSKVQIGGTLVGAGNKISGNRNGIQIRNGASGVTLQGNFIGTNLLGDDSAPQPIANSQDGVLVDASTDISVGTAGGSGGNLIARNRHGVNIQNGSTNVRVQGNRIGTQNDVNNVPDLGSLGVGVLVDNSSGVLIGGTAALAGNTIAKSTDGIQILAGSTNVTVQANLIRNNVQTGVRIVGSSGNLIGGNTVSAANIIANTKKYAGATFQVDGIYIVGGSNNTVQGNFIGTDSTSDRTFGNRGTGVLIDGSSNNLIGGLSATTEGNVIAYNWQNGIAAVENSGGAGSTVGNRFLGNSIFGNGSFNKSSLGIALNTITGTVDLNDTGDGDVGANRTQNFPVITRADVSGGQTVIDFNINSTALNNFRIEFFGTDEPNQTGSPTEYGQGKLFLGSVNVLTDGAGNFAGTFTSSIAVQPLWVVTATATDLTTNDTSEFSQAFYVNTPGPNTYVVNNDGGFYQTLGNPSLIVLNGTMTLARAITLANQHPGTDQIVFALRPRVTAGVGATGAPVFTYVSNSRSVLIDSNLPDITDTVVIDGSRLAWPQNQANVPWPGAPADSGGAPDYSLWFRNALTGFVISDNQLGADAALNPGASAQDVVLRNFQEITGSSGSGITIATAKGGASVQNIQGPGGVPGLSGIGGINGFASGGVLITNSPNNTIGGAAAGQGVTINKIGAGDGVRITGALSTGNLVQQTQIGKVFGVAGDGVLIDANAGNNTVGGTSNVSANFIVKSLRSGVHIRNSNGNQLLRNFIGNDGATTAMPNSQGGVLIEDSSNNVIGGTSLATGSVISGNTQNGVYIKGLTSSGNLIQSNIIGLNAAGTAALPNTGHGVLVENAPNTLIGSNTTDPNFISGNSLHGILISGAGAKGAVVVNNRVGLNLAANAKLGNGLDGIAVSGASDVTIGGTATNTRNIFAGNRNGIAVVNGSSLVTIHGNYIGVNQTSGNLALGNVVDGILVDNSSNVQIGGTTAETSNQITSNRNGVRIANSSTVTLQNNFIGTNLAGDTAAPQPAPNTDDGVVIDNSTNISVGTVGGLSGNVISRNRHGVFILNKSSNIRVQNNRIGTQNDASKVPDLGNLGSGVVVEASSDVTIGGTSAGAGNTIAKNADGVRIAVGSTLVSVQGNLIRNNAQSGVRIDGSSNNIVGGSVAGAKNTIANTRTYAGAKFQVNGVSIVGGGGNTVAGNFIGTDTTGSATIGNRGNGVLIDGSSNNTIGGLNAATDGNVIAYNWENGISVQQDSGGAGSANGNRLLGNSIYMCGPYKFNSLGINLNASGGFVDPNDPLDIDGGANRTQNFPVLTKVDATGGNTVIQGTINSAASTKYRVEFFGSNEPNQTGTPTEYGPGKLFLGFQDVTTDAAGNANFSFTSSTILQSLWVATATATNLTTGDTSEFSQAMYADTLGPNTYVVNNDGGFYTTLGNPNLTVLNGTMTLARAITLANQHPGTDRIFFALRPQVSVTIGTTGAPVFNYVRDSRTLLFDTNLPDITDTVVIDGSRLAWPQSAAGAPCPGAPGDGGAGIDYSLWFRNASNGIVISDNALPEDAILNPNHNAKFVVIRNFPEITGSNGIGITIATAQGGANLQNIQPPGNTVTPLGGINGFLNGAILVTNSPNNIIGGADTGQGIIINRIAAGNGVHITGALSTGNLVQQTKIGNVFGVSASGILIDGGASSNVIGGFTTSPVNTGNLIVKSNKHGIHIRNSDLNRIQRNFIGNDGANLAIPNAQDGILIEDSSFNLIGGNDLTAKNLISGNTENGVHITGVTSKGNQIQSNFIGLNAAGDVALPNSGSGVFIDNAPSTLIGSTTTAANYIAGNNIHGIRISGVGATGSIVVNNRVGLNFVGDKKLGNVQDGINISGATNITVGGGGTKAINIIGANRNGVAIVDGSSNIFVRGNHIGLNRLPDGTYPNVGNVQEGVLVQDSNSVTVGGTQSLEGNKIASNRNGVRVINSDGVTLQGNFIGTNLTGTIVPILVGLVEEFEPVFQSEDGVLVESSKNVSVGTPAQFGGNLISHNRHGVSITKGSSNVTIQNNRIGTQSLPGTFSITKHDLGNLDDGVFIDASTDVLIGGTGPSNSNILAKNLDGIQISNNSKRVTVQGNEIRNNSQSGVRIEGSFDSLIGGTTVAARNSIVNRRLIIDSTFNVDGVFLVSGSAGNTVQGNYIGTDGTPDQTLGNKGNGILVDGSSNNLIGQQFLGLPTPAVSQASNVIAFNAFNGVAVVESTGPATGNRILGNEIHSNVRLGIDLDNTAGNVTFNDKLDTDTGANNRQNFPELDLAESDSSIGIRIQGRLNSTPNRSFRIEFFYIDVANPGGSPANHGQARTYLGFMDVMTDGVGDAVFTFQNANLVLPPSEFVSATATDLTTGDTSEMSLSKSIVGAPGPNTYVVNNDGFIFPTEGALCLIPPNGGMTLAIAIRLANEHPGADRIVFAEHPQYVGVPCTTYLQESRNLFTNGDLPDITDTLIIDGSPLAWPQVKGGDKRFLQNYGVVFNKGTHGFRVSDNPTNQAKFSNPNGKAELVVIRHLNIVAPSGANIIGGVGVELASKYGGANLQDVVISGFGSDGVRISNSPNNIVGGSGASQDVSIQNVAGTGVNIIGAASTNNFVQQTNIGTTFGVGGFGIWVQGANNNTIGGFVGGTGVSIRGSNNHGIYLVNSKGTRIQRSTIGDPTSLFQNRGDGIRVQDSPLTLIGGVTAAAGNTIAGNTEHGINVLNLANPNTGGSAGLQIQSNQIGTTTAPNSGNGILITDVANVLIGSTVTAANNIDGNNLNGIFIRGAGSTGARIVNTSVGKNGGNILDGIVIDGVADVVVGGSGNNAGGTVASNRRGISLLNGSSKVTVQQMSVSGNSEEGIRIVDSNGVLIGGTSSALSGNIVTGNREGVRAQNSSNVTLQGNTITGHSEDGVIIDATGGVIVGSASQFGGNRIDKNRHGVNVINNSSNFSIQNNIIGSNAGGPGNTDDGIRLDGITSAIVGGALPLSSNFVSGNRNGLHLVNGTSKTTVLGNFFVNSVENGILLEGSSDNIIGRQTVAERNVISANALMGVYLKPDASNPLIPIFSNNNTIQGNFLGTDKNGLGNFGNGNAGIYIDGGSNNTIGGTLHDAKNKLDEGNLIGNSGASGVAVVSDSGPATGNRVIGNGVFNSGGLGINLSDNLGIVNFNDSKDLDVGANDLQNFPVITGAEAGLVSSIIQGKFNSTPNSKFRLEFFGDAVANPNGSPAGYGQGRTFIGAMDVATDANGDATYSFFAPVSFGAGGIMAATATNLATNNTSEFGEAKIVQVAVGKIEGVKFEDANGNGIRDAGEAGLPGWVIELEVADANGAFDGVVDAKATTDATGHYEFATLTDGTYKLAEVQQVGWIQMVGPVPNPVQITGGATVGNADFGNFRTVKVFGVKFEDKNGNTIRDPGEGPIAGVVINLIDAKTNATFATTKTDASGNYAFTSLYVGKFGKADTGFYRVREVVPAGFTQTTANPADFQIASGKDIGPLNFGNKGTGGGGGGGGGANIVVVGVDAGRSPQVKVYSAQSGAVLFNFFAYDMKFTGGVRVAKGDVNNDGTLDIITGPGLSGGPHIKVFDGGTGQEIQSFMAFETTMTRGVYVASGDVNNDGFDDIVVGAGSGSTARIKVFDGQTQIELFDFTAYNPLFRGGVTVAAGDVNGDGFADIITGPGAGGGPHVRVFDGSQFGQGPGVVPAELWSFMAYDPRLRTGVFVTAANINGDKRADIVTGVGSGIGGVPNVRVFDGATKAELYNFYAFGDEKTPLPKSMFLNDPRYVTGIRVATVDFNNDGIDDIATTPGRAKAPRLKVYDGSITSTHSKLFDAMAFDPFFLGGVFVG